MTAAIRIGIMGDFEPTYHSHFATNAALYDAAAKLKAPPPVFLSVPLLFLLVAFLATAVPARRALGVDPMVALRQN